MIRFTMKITEMLAIALFATGLSLTAWLLIYFITGGENSFFSSYYSVLIFPPLFVGLILFIRYLARRPKRL